VNFPCNAVTYYEFTFTTFMQRLQKWWTFCRVRQMLR